MGRNVTLLMPEPDRSHHDEYIRNYLKTGEKKVIGRGREVIALRKDGSSFPMEISISEAVLPGGRIFTAMVQDISERKRIEDALRQSEETLRLAVDAADIGIWDWPVAQDEVRCSERCRALFGWPAGVRVTYEKFIAALHPDDRPQVVGKIQSAIESRGDYKVEMRTFWPDGSLHWVFASGAAYPSGTGNAVRMSGVAIDITERKVSEERRMQREAQQEKAERLESVGILAGGVAHDFNNLLAGMFGYLELSRSYAACGEQGRLLPCLDKALGAFEKARELTRHLLTFASGGAPVKTIISMDGLLRQAVATQAGGALVVRLEAPVDLWQCEGDSTQLQQLLDNLLRNAKEAMRGSGTVTISARNLAEPAALPEILPPGRYVHIAVRDEGPGIPAEIMDHIFDPFFSTKETGHGLGLSIAYSVARRHGGAVVAESGSGRGAVFHVYLPAYVA